MNHRSTPFLLACVALTLPVSPSSSARMQTESFAAALTPLPRAVQAALEAIDEREGRSTSASLLEERLTEAETNDLASSLRGLPEADTPTAAPDIAANGSKANALGTTARWGNALSATALGTLRGGVDLGGLTVSIGLTRTVTQTGQVISSTVVSVPDITLMTSDQARLLGSQLGTITTLTRAGLLPGLSAPITVIQNALDNQNLSVSTVIDATVNSLSLLKSLGIHTAVQLGVINSTRR